MKTKFIFSLICVAAVTLTACEQYPYAYGRFGYAYGYPYSSTNDYPTFVPVVIPRYGMPVVIAGYGGWGYPYSGNRY